ncbi:MAG: outer membrane protein assembly factor [Candidatus Gastranaerophilaceae bacterium]
MLLVLLQICTSVCCASTDVETTPTYNEYSYSEDENIQQLQYIHDIEIVGTNVVSPSYILSKFNVHNGDIYNAENIQNGLKSLYQLGFFTDRMKAVPIENSDGSITLKLVLEENLPITNVTIDGNSAVSTDELIQYLIPLIGQPQNIGKINDAIEAINECYNSKGYILARVSNVSDDPDGTINLEIVEGTINKIMIAGNKKTKDYVIARNIMTEPGMIYNDNQLKKDLVRLYSTQAFKNVDRSIEPCEDDPNKFNVTINVEEQRTATISLGGGLDSHTGAFGSVGISDNNFRGVNQRLAINGLVGSGIIMSDSTIKDHMNLQGELSFFEPYFLNADNSLMSKLFYRNLGSYQVPLAVEERFGLEATIGHKIKSNEHLSSTLSFGLEKINVMEGDRNRVEGMYAAKGLNIAERAKQLEGGMFFNISPGLVYDTRDSALNPRNGVLATARYDESFGFDRINKTNGRLSGMVKKFVPIAKLSSLSFTARAGGKIHGDNMPEVMAYRLGGPYTIRGFKVNGVGTGDAYVMGSVELATPVFFLDRLKANFFKNLRLTFFVDAGKVFQPYITDTLFDRPMQAITAGVGLKLYVPGIGPLSVDYGIPLTNPGSYGSKGGYFTFGVGDLMY